MAVYRVTEVFSVLVIDLAVGLIALVSRLGRRSVGLVGAGVPMGIVYLHSGFPVACAKIFDSFHF